LFIERACSCSDPGTLVVAAPAAPLRFATAVAIAVLRLSWQRVVEAYEADKQELQQDNAALRKALHDLQVRYKHSCCLCSRGMQNPWLKAADCS
jgi:hypothetical protein